MASQLHNWILLYLEFQADAVPDEADVVDAELELLVAKTLAEREEAGEDFARERDHVVFREGPLKKKWILRLLRLFSYPNNTYNA